MEGILKFNLIEEKREFEMAIKGADCHYALEKIDALLKYRLKSEDDPKIETVIQDIRDQFHRVVLEYGISLFSE